MPQHEPVTILLVNDIGEEVKLVTLSFRSFFPGCRVDAVYSLDEALQWTARADWHLLLIDERLLAERPTPALPELRRLAPSATVVLQTDRSDSAAAANALQAGADFLLYKKSPAFLTELMLYTREAIEKRTLRLALERMQERHTRLVEMLADALYELDAEGRFVHLSPSITPLLGYTPDELKGMLYTAIIPPDQIDQVRHPFRERRTGPRAARRVRIELMRKGAAADSTQARVAVELSAKGLYDPHRRFQGTLGLLRDLSQHREQEARIQQLERRLREQAHLADVGRRLSELSTHLQQPLAAVLSQSQQLLAALRDARLEQQVHRLLEHAAEAARHGTALAHTALPVPGHSPTLNDVWDRVLADTQPPLWQTRLEREYGAQLPPCGGDLAALERLLKQLLIFTHTSLSAAGRSHRVRLATAALDAAGTPLDPHPTLFPKTAAAVQIRIDETELPSEPWPPPHEPADLHALYSAVHHLGGRLELVAPAAGPLSISAWLPADQRPLKHLEPAPTAPSAPTIVEPPAPSPAEPGPAEVRPLQAESTAALPDRRRAPRLSVHLPARITLDAVTRDGHVLTLGPGGAGLLIEGTLPPLEGQPAYVVFKTAAGLLEIQALAHHRGPSLRAPSEPPASMLALQFTSLTEVERQVLASLLEELRERTLPLTVEALLSLPEESLQPVPPGQEADLRGRDHREALRVRVALPARIERLPADVSPSRPLALMINVSRTGACLQMKEAPGPAGQRLALHFSATESAVFRRPHEPEGPEAVLTGEVIWTAPDHGAPSELRPGPTAPGQRIGFRLDRLTAFAEREVNRVVAQHVGSMMDLEGIAARSTIVSARRECRNARQQIIAVTDDHARHQISPSTPIVVIIPGFGKTQTDYLALAFFLAANRLRVLRYDHTNHVGQSEGDVLQTTLRSMQADCEQVVAFARHTWPTAPLTVLAEDIGARVALKALARTRDGASLLCLNPILDVGVALDRAYRRDVFGDYQQGLRRGVANLWGLNVNLDQFLGDALAGDYATAASSAADVAALSAPWRILTTPRPGDHAAGQVETALRIFGTPPAIESLTAEVSQESAAFDERQVGAWQRIAERVWNAASPERHPEPLREVPLREIVRQRQLERERVRLHHHVSQATRAALWIAHTAQLSQLSNLHDYWRLREELYRRLLPLEPGASILDVGCGHGDLARVIVTNQAYAAAHRGGPPATGIRYIGLAPSDDAVAAAEQSARTFQREIGGLFAAAGTLEPAVSLEWRRFAWDEALPGEPGSVSRVVFHLTLAFCPSPLQAIRRALHILAPDGLLVMTTFRPQTDLSGLFRRHLLTGGQEEFSAPAQIALHYLGRLREALRHGLLHSHERTDLAHLLAHAGAAPVDVRPVLDGQLLMAVARKGNSAG